MTTTGRCHCGEVTWKYEGAESWSCFCHCEDCRRICSAPVTAYLGVRSSKVQWTGAKPAAYQSSPGVTRHFCATCGTPMGYEAMMFPGEVHLFAASMDDPDSAKPTFHVQYAERLPWLRIGDDLPKFERFATKDPNA
jgi:hypothetical protein